MSLLTWSTQVTACTNGETLPQQSGERLQLANIPYRTEKILYLDGTNGRLRKIEFSVGLPMKCDAIFFSETQFQQSELPERLGCQRKEKGQIRTKDKHRTTQAGIFVAGDADGHVQFAVIAAAEGATAATAINLELQHEDIKAIQVAQRTPAEST